MKILVVGAMHGNEPLGVEVVSIVAKNPIENVTAVIANQKAQAMDKRFVKQDLNRSFPGDVKSRVYEKARAAELLAFSGGFDLVLDFHNTHTPGNDCVFIGEGASEILFRFASYAGLRRVVVADYECINKYAKNCVSVEISLGSVLMDAKFWVKIIEKLSKLLSLPKAKKLEKYKFVYRISLDDCDRFSLCDKNLRAFKPIPKNIADTLCVKSPAYGIFIGDGYTPYNYGGLLNKY